MLCSCGASATRHLGKNSTPSHRMYARTHACTRAQYCIYIFACMDQNNNTNYRVLGKRFIPCSTGRLNHTASAHQAAIHGDQNISF